MPLVSGYLLDGRQSSIVARVLADEVRREHARGGRRDREIEALSEEIGVIARAWKASITDDGNADGNGNANRVDQSMRDREEHANRLDDSRTGTTREAAEMLGLQPRQIRNLLNAGTLEEADPVGRTRMVVIESVERETERRLRACTRTRARGSEAPARPRT